MMKPHVLMLSSTREAALRRLEDGYVLHRLDEASDPQAMLASIVPRFAPSSPMVMRRSTRRFSPTCPRSKSFAAHQPATTLLISKLSPAARSG